MKSDIITLNKDKLIYMGKTYTYCDFFEKVKMLKNRIIVILNESIYIKKVDIGLKENDLIEYIDTYAEEEFRTGEDYLMDYKLNESGNKLYIYAIKSGKRVTKLCKGAKNITVLPIQTIMMNKIKKKYNTNSYTCFFSYNDIFYWIKVKDKLMEDSSNVININEIEKKIIDINSDDIIFITKDLEVIFNKFDFKVILLDDGDFINEKICN